MMPITYTIIPTAKLTEAMFKAAIESKDTCRCSLDDSETVLSYEGAKEDCPEALKGFDLYYENEIMPIMNGPKWSEKD